MNTAPCSTQTPRVGVQTTPTIITADYLGGFRPRTPPRSPDGNSRAQFNALFAGFNERNGGARKSAVEILDEALGISTGRIAATPLSSNSSFMRTSAPASPQRPGQ